MTDWPQVKDGERLDDRRAVYVAVMHLYQAEGEE
jgi:hypothetical protein